MSFLFVFSLATSASISAAPGGSGDPLRLPLLLPASPEFVLWVDYDALRGSDLVADLHAHLEALPEPAEEYGRFVRETGLDPRVDLDRLLFSMSKLGGNADPPFLMVAHGRLAPSRLLEAAAERGGQLLMIEGAKVWSSHPKNGDSAAASGSSPTVFLAQPDDRTLLFGTEDEVKRALQVFLGKRRPDSQDPTLQELLSGVDKKAPVWAVLNSASLTRHLTQVLQGDISEFQPGSAFAAIKVVRLMAWVAQDVDLKVTLEAVDQESAGLLADLARGALAAAKLQAKDRDPEWLQALQQARVRESSEIMEIQIRIPTSRFREAGETGPTP